MRVSVPSPSVARFDGFEVDLESGELRHSGVRVHLGEQPTRVLLTLLHTPGALVTRDQLKTALWPPNTFVDDADQGLNAAVKRVRDALHDTADEPRFIETIPRRGYRFVGVLERHAPDAAEPTGGARRPLRSRGWTRLALVAAGAAVCAAGWILWAPAAPRVTSVRPLVSHLELVGASPVDEWSWASDGVRVYFAIRRKTAQAIGSSALYQAPVAGGDLVEMPLPCPYATTVLGYVRSESALLIQGMTERQGVEDNPSEIPLWLVPVPSGAPRRIPNVSGYAAAVSKDDRMLASIRGTATKGHSMVAQPRLWTARLDGSDLIERGPLPAFTLDARWAPDGRHLRVVLLSRSGNEADSTLWDVAADGTTPQRLWPGSLGDWTPDGRYYIFGRLDPWSRRYDLFAHRERRWLWPRDRPPRQLTVGPISFASPRPSADGRQILAYGQETRGELMRYDATTRKYVSALGGESALDVEPSPDGQWLLWVRYPEGSLWRSRVDGTERQMLTGRPLEVHMPRWSPDGRQIVFVARSPEAPAMALYLAAADGSAREVLVPPDREMNPLWNPCWMPDGTVLYSTLFWRNPPGIRQVDLRSKRVTTVPGAELLRWPVTSRQGDVLAAGGEATRIQRFVRRHGSVRWEHLGPYNLGYPRWTRDGRALCGCSDPSPIACVDVRTGQLTPFEVQPSFPLVVRPRLGCWTGLDVDDRPLVTADRSTAGFYGLEWDAP